MGTDCRVLGGKALGSDDFRIVTVDYILLRTEDSHHSISVCTDASRKISFPSSGVDT
jgi:hypothetical protein